MATKGRRELAEKIVTPSKLQYPTFLMNFPFTVSNEIRNNVLMKDVEPYNYPRAFAQWLDLYGSIIDAGGLVYILPSERDFQDLPYVANMGCYLPHLEEDVVLVSNFYSPPRMGEEVIGVKFFDMMRYTTRMCPHYWEGEADLKWLHDNVYVAPHGIRTEKAAHAWMESNFFMKVIPLELTDNKLYHLDCVLFPLTNEKTVVATSVLQDEDLAVLEKETEILDIPKEFIYNGWTNAVRIGKTIFHASDSSNREIEHFYGKHGFDTRPIVLNEFDKSGADLSCLIMHFNYIR